MEVISDILSSLLIGSGILLAVGIGSLIILVVSLISNWKCFIKIGEDGWKSIIPIYNSYILHEHIWGNGWMFLINLIPVVGQIFTIITNWKFFRGFGKSVLFCLAAIPFHPICLAVCAFDSSTFAKAN